MSLREQAVTAPTGEWTADVYFGELTRLRQTVPAHRPGEGAIGDCYRTAIACLLGLKDPKWVPHFVEIRMQTGDTRWEDFRLARHWLRAEHDRDLLYVDLDQAVDLGCHYLAVVKSKTGAWPHVVIGIERTVAHDPSGLDAYDWADLIEGEPVEILTTPYQPDPDEMVRRWLTEAPK